MKILVHAGSLAGAGERMRLAAAGLALRGHRVLWLGLAPGGADEAVRGWSGLVGVSGGIVRGLAVDVVLGGGGAIPQVALAGWLAGAHGMVVALEGSTPRLDPLARWCWGSLESTGLVAAGAPPGGPETLDPAALARWPDEPPPGTPDAAHPDTELLERLLENKASRWRGARKRGAVFLDRDGTLVVERGYLAHAEDLELLPGVPQALQSLAAAGYALVVVSNQSGVGRGFFPSASVYAAMARLRTELRGFGVEIDAVYFCPHRPDAGCACRKPSAELLRRAAANLSLTLRDSFMIGDKLLDVETGHNAKARAILVRTGYGRDEERRAEPALEPPDAVVDDLTTAAQWIEAQASLET